MGSYGENFCEPNEQYRLSNIFIVTRESVHCGHGDSRAKLMDVVIIALRSHFDSPNHTPQVL